MSETVKDRLAAYLAAKKVSKSEFGRRIGVSSSYISSMRKSIQPDKVASIAREFPDLNMSWLMTGDGPMLVEERDGLSGSVPLASHDDGDGIPLIPVEAMAGMFRGERTVLEYECERYIVPAFEGADFLVRVTGDSMVPTFRSGDIVACQRVPLADLFFQWNRVYVLDTTQGAIIKRVRRAEDDGHILIVSDNADYAPFELPREQLHGLALVRGLIRLE